MLLVKKFENFKSRKMFKRVPSQGQCQLQIDTCHGHLPSTSTMIKSWAAVAPDLQHPPRRVQGGEQKWGESWQDRSSARYFRSWFYDPNFCISSYRGKHQNPSWWRVFLLTSRSITRLGENFWEKYVLDCIYSPFTKITHILIFHHPHLHPRLFGAAS